MAEPLNSTEVTETTKPVTPTGSNGGSDNGEQDSKLQIASQLKARVEALIAAGDFGAAAALAASPGATPDLAMIVETEKSKAPEAAAAPTQAAGTSAAPTTKVAENEPEKAPAQVVEAAPSPDQNKPSATTLINKAADSMEAFKVALQNGAAYGLEMVAATKDAIKLEVIPSGGKKGAEPDSPQETKMAQSADTALTSLKADALSAIKDLIKAGSFNVLSEGSKPLDLGGTGNFASLGDRAATSLADTAVTNAKGADAPPR